MVESSVSSIGRCHRRRYSWLLLGVTVHEFMLISICQCLCHIMIVSWSHGFIGLVVSVVSYFHVFRGFIGLVVLIVSWFHRFRGVNGFIVSWVSWCQWFHGFIGFVVSVVSWFHRFRGVSGFMVS